MNFLRGALAVLADGIMGTKASVKTVAGYGERRPDRVTQRNGCCSRSRDTRVGTIELRIPKLIDGSYLFRACLSRGVGARRLDWQ